MKVINGMRTTFHLPCMRLNNIRPKCSSLHRFRLHIGTAPNRSLTRPASAAPFGIGGPIPCQLINMNANIVVHLAVAS